MALEQLELVGGVGPGLALLGGGPLGVDDLLGRLGRAAGGAGEADELAGAPVDDAAEVAGDAHRPGDRRGGDADLLLDLVEQLERRRGPGRSHLLMKVRIGRSAGRGTPRTA